MIRALPFAAGGQTRVVQDRHGVFGRRVLVPAGSGESWRTGRPASGRELHRRILRRFWEQRLTIPGANLRVYGERVGRSQRRSARAPPATTATRVLYQRWRRRHCRVLRLAPRRRTRTPYGLGMWSSSSSPAGEWCARCRQTARSHVRPGGATAVTQRAACSFPQEAGYHPDVSTGTRGLWDVSSESAPHSPSATAKLQQEARAFMAPTCCHHQTGC